MAGRNGGYDLQHTRDFGDGAGPVTVTHREYTNEQLGSKPIPHALNTSDTVPNRTEDPHDPPSRVGSGVGMRGSASRNTSSVTGGDSKGRYS